MSMDKSDSPEAGGSKGPSMKERLLAQRKAEADAAAKAAADPKLAAAASRPAAAPPPKAAPAPKPAPAVSARARVAAANAASGAPSAVERMAARRGAPHPHTELSPDVKREVQLLKERESKTMTYVWIICGVLFLAAGGVLGNTLMKRAKDAAATAAVEKSLDDLKDKVTRLDPLKETEAHQILGIANESANPSRGSCSRSRSRCRESGAPRSP